MTKDALLKYAHLIGPLRAVARAHGYALTIHGSLERDIDLVAVPWVDRASAPADLAEALRVEAARVNGAAWCAESLDADNPEHFRLGMPGYKPHGRLVWAFQLGGTYLDLSVMPPRTQDAES